MESIEFLGFGIDAWTTIVTVFTVFTELLTTKWRSDIVFLGAIGVLSVIAMRRLLPDRKAPEEAFEATSEYTVELRVPSDNPLIGKTLGEAGLFNVKGGSLIEICHIDDVPSPVTENEILMSGDHLVFAGQIDELYDMAVRYQLVASDQRVFSMDEVDMNCQIRTAYVTFGSSLKGHSIAESTLERENNLMVAAVARRGERINEAPRKVVLEAGDTLLLVCPKHFSDDTASLRSNLHFFDSDDVPNIGLGTIFSTIGGYRFSDFMRIGLLMNIIILAANILIVNIVYPLTPLQ
ncbi:MAG: TrkA C-terminal domain-containing protein [Muribaculaceae bacterium]|nr:TrkA C-terminal domain-containing protein [Muribaculaceae bacterium]